MPFKPFSKHSITITLSGPTAADHTYSTLDAIKGVVDFSTKSDAQFSSIDVALVGSAVTMVDAAGRTGALAGGESQATHQFLKLTQPVCFEQLGLEDKVLKAGVRYRIPFTFVVPTHLLPRACTHRSLNASVKDTHLQLPPTLGRHSGSKSNFSFLVAPDFAADGAKIEYQIKASILNGAPKRLVAHTEQKVRIAPAFEELPPLSLEDVDGPYVLRKEKKVKKTIFSKPTGRVAVAVEQPASFRLPSANTVSYDPTTYVRLNLRFDPAHANDIPPALSSLSSKLLVTTSWATTARTELVHQVPRDHAYRDITSDSLTDEVILSPLTLNTGTKWVPHLPPSTENLDHRCSVISTASSFAPESKKDVIISPTKSSVSSLPFYTSSVIVPVSLPLSKHTWLPTFHSCLISRTYAISLSLNATSAKLDLVVPVQVSQKHTQRALDALEVAETQAQAAIEAEEAFIARSTLGVAVPRTPSDITRIGFPAVIGSSRASSVHEHESPPDYEEALKRNEARVNTDGFRPRF